MSTRRAASPPLSIVLAVVAALAVAGCGDDEPLTLTVYASDGAAGEVLLDWTGGRQGVEGWEYRYRRAWGSRTIEGDPGQRVRVPDEWGDWRGVPRPHAETGRHRVGGLSAFTLYEFQVRQGEGEPSEPVVAVPSRAGPDGIVDAKGQYLLEPGGTFRLHNGHYVFTVPTSGLWTVVSTGWEYWIRENVTGAAVGVQPVTGRELGRDREHDTGVRDMSAPTIPPNVEALLDDILDSLRFAPAAVPPPANDHRMVAVPSGFVFDIPPGLSVDVSTGWQEWSQTGDLLWRVYILDLGSGSWLLFGESEGEWLDGYVTAVGLARGVDALFDQIVESTRPAP